MCVCCSSFGKKSPPPSWRLVQENYSKFCISTCSIRGYPSIWLINKGLSPHLDNVIPNQPDPYKCAPGISVSVHLGDPEDSVFLKFHHESVCHELSPGKMAVFPGYALIHRTLRPIPPTPKRRYSVVLFFQFKRDCADKMDKYIRGSFPFIQTAEYRATV